MSEIGPITTERLIAALTRMDISHHVSPARHMVSTKVAPPTSGEPNFFATFYVEDPATMMTHMTVERTFSIVDATGLFISINDLHAATAWPKFYLHNEALGEDELFSLIAEHVTYVTDGISDDGLEKQVELALASGHQRIYELLRRLDQTLEESDRAMKSYHDWLLEQRHAKQTVERLDASSELS